MSRGRRDEHIFSLADGRGLKADLKILSLSLTHDKDIKMTLVNVSYPLGIFEAKINIALTEEEELTKGLTEENTQLGIISPIGYFQ